MTQTHLTPHYRFSRDGLRIFQILEAQVRIWDVAGRRCICNMDGRYIGLSRAEDTLLVQSGAQILAWDLTTCGLKDLRAVSATAFLRYERAALLVGVRQVTIRDVFGEAQLIEVNTIDQIEQFDGIAKALNAPYAAVIVSYDLHGFEGVMGISIDLETGAIAPGSFQVERTGSRYLAYSARPDRLVVSLMPRGEVTVYDLTSGRATHRVKINAACVASSPVNSDLLALVDPQSGLIQFLNLETGQLVGKIEDAQPAEDIVFHPLGQQIVCGYGGGCFRLWELETGQMVWDCTGKLE